VLTFGPFRESALRATISSFSDPTDNDDMSHAPLLSSVTEDQLLLAGFVLQALECGRMPMHAAGYQEVSIWAAGELAGMDTPTLQSLHRRVPDPLGQLVENLLHERAEAAWTSNWWALSAADVVWASLLESL